MDLQEFNTLSAPDAAQAIRPCLDVQRWIDEIVAARPYASVQDATAQAERSGAALTPDEVEQALSHHPRIGERADGESSEAQLSRGEQAGLGTLDEDVTTRLARGNAAYEERFDRVFLIRAAGRTPEEILGELERRMQNSPEQEAAEVADQLTQIAILRLEGLLS